MNTSIHEKDIEGVTSWPGFLKLGGYDASELGTEILEPFDWAPVDAAEFRRQVMRYTDVLDQRDARIGALVNSLGRICAEDLVGRGVVYREGSTLPSFGRKV